MKNLSDEQTMKENITRNAITNAVNSCIEEGIMKGYLEEHAKEVIETLMLQWDNELAMQARYDDGFDDGVEFVAKNMIRKGLPLDIIREMTNLSVERINEIAESLKK